MAQPPRYEPDWKQSHAVGESSAFSHAWVDWTVANGTLTVTVNEYKVLRVAIKYSESGPYLAIEQNDAARSHESMGACRRAGGIAQRYNALLEAHNAVGDLLQSGRVFLIKEANEEIQAAQRGADEAA